MLIDYRRDLLGFLSFLWQNPLNHLLIMVRQYIFNNFKLSWKVEINPEIPAAKHGPWEMQSKYVNS